MEEATGMGNRRGWMVTTRSGRFYLVDTPSGDSGEEVLELLERKEAEEKVIWIFQKKFLNICSLRWEGTPSL